MTLDLWRLVLLCALGSTVAATVAAWIVMSYTERLLTGRADRPASEADATGITSFVFERARLIDASQPARDYLSMLGDENWSYSGLIGHLSKSFPDLRRALLTVARTGAENVVSFDNTRSARITQDGDRTRLTIQAAETDIVTLDRGSHASLEIELESLRAMGDQLVYPTWRQSPDGIVSWVNRAYLDLAQARCGAAASKWPPPVLFPDLDPATLDGHMRIELTIGDAEPAWFDCHCARLDDDLFVTAVPADKLLKAERTLAEFTQTFSRTFAHLTVGIAVFDRNRELVMFNPALTDLTTLPIDLMLSRPRLESFLDALRARNMMPEPKDYASWRQRVADVETASQDGTYSELWHLPGDRTYRITGRPQVDGAFALLLEDISADVSLTRRFRTEIETGHAILNALPDAIAVFDRGGFLLQTNQTYDALWGIDSQEGMTHMGVRDAIQHWDRASAPSAAWSEARTHLTHDLCDEGWSTEIQLLDGRALTLKITPMPAAMRLVRFTAAPKVRQSRLVPVEAQDRIQKLLKA